MHIQHYHIDLNIHVNDQITFHDFFGISALEKKFNKHQIISLNEEDKAYTIFSSIPNKKMFYLRKKKKKC